MYNSTIKQILRLILVQMRLIGAFVCSFLPIANNSTPALRKLSAGGMTSSWDFPSVIRIPIFGIPTREPDSGLKQFSKIKVNARPGDKRRVCYRIRTKMGKLPREKSKCEKQEQSGGVAYTVVVVEQW